MGTVNEYLNMKISHQPYLELQMQVSLGKMTSRMTQNFAKFERRLYWNL